MGTRFFGVVPARSGSKGLPEKNIRAFNGTSLLQSAVRCSVGVLAISQTFVTSDSQSYLDSIGHISGNVVPILRSADASSSSATAADVVLELLRCRKDIVGTDCIVYLQPTSPLRTSTHVMDAIRLMQNRDANSIVSVVQSANHPQKALKLDIEGKLAPFIADAGLPTANRQQLEPSLHPNGAIYIFRVADFLKLGDIPVVGAYPFPMTQRDSLDVDSAEDFAYLEFVVKNVKL